MNGGKQTIIFEKQPIWQYGYSIVGPKEGKGPLGEYYDNVLKDDVFGEKSYEKTERKMHVEAVKGCLNKAKLKPEQIDVVVAGDLLNQIIASSFGARELGIPFIGVYSACGSFGEALIVGSSLIASGAAQNVCCSTSSHFSTAERQFRYPLELGTQQAPCSQWTVTAAGCSLLSSQGEGVRITSATVSKVLDFEIKDVNNMGACMAPAAADTVAQHLKALGVSPSYYDIILTGDLGCFGSKLFCILMQEKGFNVEGTHQDCGCMIFDKSQKVMQGGSGAGASSSVFNSYIYTLFATKQVKKVLLVPTGALLSRLSSLQGETIPSIAHAISFEV